MDGRTLSSGVLLEKHAAAARRVISEVLPLEQAAEGLERSRAGAANGKVLLDCGLTMLPEGDARDGRSGIGTRQRRPDGQPFCRGLRGSQDAIVSAEIAAGEVVERGRLGGRLGMSRTPIREALSRFSQEGLVETVSPTAARSSVTCRLGPARHLPAARQSSRRSRLTEAVLRLTETEILEAEDGWTDLARSLEAGEDSRL